MSVTDEAIENVADAFCMLSSPAYRAQHRALYVESMKAIARMSAAEVLFRMELDLDQASAALRH